MTSWKQFWDMTQEELSGRVSVHDYQLTTIGNALKSFGYSFNSNDETGVVTLRRITPNKAQAEYVTVGSRGTATLTKL